MKKVRVNYINHDDEILMAESIYYFELPPIGRSIIWMKTEYKVTHIGENWDTKLIEVNLVMQ